MKIAVILAVLLVLPVISYGAIHEGVSIHLVGMDFLHLLIGYALVAAILSFLEATKVVSYS